MAPVADHVPIHAPGITLPYSIADRTYALFGAVQVKQFFTADKTTGLVTGILTPIDTRGDFIVLSGHGIRAGQMNRVEDSSQAMVF